MTKEHTESTERLDALNRLTDEGTDAIDPSHVTSLASRVTGGFESGTFPIAGGGLLLYGAMKQLRHRPGRAILQAIAGAGLLAVGLRQRTASESEDGDENEWDPLEGDQGVSDAPGTSDDGGDPLESESESGIDASEIADEIGSTLSERVPISDESASENDGDDESGDTPLDTDEQLDVHVTGAPESGEPESVGGATADRQDETDTGAGDEEMSDESSDESDDDQFGQDETDLETDTGSNGSIDEDELSEENEDKDEDIHGP
ncbi:hypothetical protein OB955_10875 [Halobacteria archaeon AArc-m2/3/4]|uniref:Uncharacterized protein n=1 Tax=Natronoglomus mannanivorans TaxID=2979990 RepID=A0AAP2YYP3_9EURY|nr:hypothetical protein [Halobacteria archaeon AArc-xg1-1]MCU4973245.1 hypothetical protein [Halobacteria archaeon AArc-m2/3/4]